MDLQAILGIFLAFGFTLGTAETITFDSAKAGYIPPGWTVTSTDVGQPGRWQVQSDNTAPSKPYVLARSSPHSERGDYSIALFDKGSCRDGVITVDMKLLSGHFGQSGGVVWRFQNTANFYFALASADKDSVGIYKKVNNQVSLLAHASVPHEIEDKEWNVLKVSFRGPRFLLFFGHRKLIDAQDGALGTAGKTGVWAKADTVAYFDNYQLSSKN